MQKRWHNILFLSLTFLILSLSLVLADNHTAITNEAAPTEAKTDTAEKPAETTAELKNESPQEDHLEKYADEKLERGAGITPDSPFYFIEDNIFTFFRDDVSNKEKKIAEVRQMIKEKKYDAARRSLDRYKSYADDIEKEVNSENKEEVQKSAAAIRNALKELESEIPDKEKKEFIDDVIKKEERISTAAEVAQKIKELCETLSKLDPEQYAITCKTDKEAPEWQKKLDKRLTDEQRKEAEEFFKTMSSCFEDPKNCPCHTISIKKFADSCSKIAPLAVKCEEGDENACQEMDEVEDPIEYLPPHLRDAMEKVEDRYDDSKHDNFQPPECRREKTKTREECMQVMFKANAPEECAEAAKQGKIDFKNERAMRESCEKIMFLENAQEECIKEGLKDYKECGKFMFKSHAPEECIEAGLTGESPRDHKKCEQIMRLQEGKEGKGPRGPGPQGFAFGKNCAHIENKDEKLKCFEEAFNSVQQGPGDKGHDGGYRRQGPGGGWPEQCIKENAKTKESCEQVMKSDFERRSKETRDYEDKFAKECLASGGAWDCSFSSIDPSNPCRCFNQEKREERGKYEDKNRQPRENEDRNREQYGQQYGQFNQYPTQGQGPPPGFQGEGQCRDSSGNTVPCQGPPPGSYQVPPLPPGFQAPPQSPTQEQQTTPQTTTTTAPTTTTTPTQEQQPAPQTSGTTGSVIAVDNDFYNYYFRT